jgi:hypothetical protein
VRAYRKSRIYSRQDSPRTYPEVEFERARVSGRKVSRNEQDKRAGSTGGRSFRCACHDGFLFATQAERQRVDLYLLHPWINKLCAVFDA